MPARGRLRTVVVTICLVVTACDSRPPSDPPEPSVTDPPPSAAAASGSTAVIPTASPASAPSLGPIPDPPIDAVRPLPEPVLVDPFTVGAALYDPTQIEQGVVSLLDLMGVGIDDVDGGPLRPDTEHADAFVRLTEPEVWGLISMGRADLTADPDGEIPYTFSDLHRGLAPFLPGVTAGDLADEFADAYERRPDDLVPQVMLGQPIEVDTPLTRVHLWLLFADGFVIPTGPRTASLGDGFDPRTARTGNWGTAATIATGLTPPPGLHPADLAAILLGLRTAGFALGLGVFPVPTIHEGHGRPGRTQEIIAGLLGGGPIPQVLAPYVRMGGVVPFDLTLRTSVPSLWQSHGSLDFGFDRPRQVTAVTRSMFHPKQEEADGRGDVVIDLVDIWASAKAADAVTSVYDLPIDRATLNALLPGDIASQPLPVGMQWHTDQGIQVAMTNHFDVKLGLRGVIGVGDATANGADSIFGFLPRRDEDIYRGTLISSGEATVTCSFLDAQVRETITSRQSLDVYVEVRPGSRRDPMSFPVASGVFGPEDAHMTFYPAGPPIDSAGECVQPIFSRGGGPLDRFDLTYRWFNNSRWTDPNVGYTIGLPQSESTVYYWDNRLSKEALSGPGGISGVDSTWDVTVTKVGH